MADGPGDRVVRLASTELRTERLLLRPFREDDVDAFARFAETEPYLRHLDDGHPRPEQFVANNVGLDGAWVIELGGRVVGSVFLDEELACLLDPDVHAQGIGTEAAAAVIADAFERRGFAEVRARARLENISSVRALTRLGFADDGGGVYRLDRHAWASRSSSSGGG